jgi:hypothetical protein
MVFRLLGCSARAAAVLQFHREIGSLLLYEHIVLKKRVKWFPYVTYDLCTLSIYITSM